MRSGGGGLGDLGSLGSALRQQQRALRSLQDGPPPSFRHSFRRVSACFRPYRFSPALGTVLMLGGLGLMLIPPLLIRDLIDVAIPQRDLPLVMLLGSGIFLLPLGGAVLGRLSPRKTTVDRSLRGSDTFSVAGSPLAS